MMPHGGGSCLGGGAGERAESGSEEARGRPPAGGRSTQTAKPEGPSLQAQFSDYSLCDSECSVHTTGSGGPEPWGHRHRSSATPGALFKRNLKSVS